MENENLSDSDYYIYVFMGRIVRIAKTRRLYEVVKLSDVSSYSISYIPKNISIDELVYNYGFSLTDNKRFYKCEDILSEETKNELIITTNKIVLLEKFKNATDTLKKVFFQNNTHVDIYNRLLMNEIEMYDRNKEIGVLLEAELYCSVFKSYEALIESIKLKYKDASEIFAYIKYKDYEFHNLLKETNFVACEKIINEIYQKLAV